MTDPVERSLERFAPPGPSDDLRDRVLLAVEAELCVPRWRWPWPILRRMVRTLLSPISSRLTEYFKDTYE